MHLTSSHLKQIIKEELQKVITEGTWQKETRQMTRELFDIVKRDDKTIKYAIETGYLQGGARQPPGKLLRNIGIEEVYVTWRPATGDDLAILQGNAFRVGGSYNAGASTSSGLVYTTAMPRVPGKPNLQIPSGANAIEIQILFDPNKIKTLDDLRGHFNELYSGIQKTARHELFHHRQWGRPGKISVYVDSYKPSAAELSSQFPDLEDRRRARAVSEWSWGSHMDPLTLPKGTSKQARYLLSKVETEAHVRGFYHQAKKSKGRLNFQHLADQRLKVALDLGYISSAESAMIRKQWMAYAEQYVPCARLASGEFINPKGCGMSRALKKKKKKKRSRRARSQSREAKARQKAAAKQFVENPKASFSSVARRYLPWVFASMVMTDITLAADDAYKECGGGMRGLNCAANAVAGSIAGTVYDTITMKFERELAAWSWDVAKEAYKIEKKDPRSFLRHAAPRPDPKHPIPSTITAFKAGGMY